MAMGYQIFHRDKNISPSSNDSKRKFRNKFNKKLNCRKLTATISVDEQELEQSENSAKNEHPPSSIGKVELIHSINDHPSTGDVKIHLIPANELKIPIKSILKNSPRFDSIDIDSRQMSLWSSQPCNLNDKANSEPKKTSSMKHVTFSEKISRKKYRPNQPVRNLKTLSNRFQIEMNDVPIDRQIEKNSDSTNSKLT